MQTPKWLNESTLIILSFFCIYFIWGSTYLATAWVFDMFPPFLMLGLRMTAAGLLLLFFSYKGLKGLTWKQVLNAAYFGILILGIGTGCCMWAIQFMDSGLVALIVGAQPLALVLMGWLLLKNRPSVWRMLGVLLGMLGMFVLIQQDKIQTDPGAYKGIIAVSVSILAWSFSALYIKKADMPKSKLTSAALQMLAAGGVLLLVSWGFQEPISQLSTQFSWLSIACLGYLIVFGSIVAYSAYNYLLMVEDPNKVATTTYVNPVIALFLGWCFNNEQLSLQALIAATVLIIGVVFIVGKEPNWAKWRQRRLQVRLKK